MNKENPNPNNPFSPRALPALKKKADKSRVLPKNSLFKCRTYGELAEKLHVHYMERLNNYAEVTLGNCSVADYTPAQLNQYLILERMRIDLDNLLWMILPTEGVPSSVSDDVLLSRVYNLYAAIPLM